jgi:hypothetical protein
MAAQNADDFIGSTVIAQEIRADPTFSYRKLMGGCADGKYAPPMERRNGRWGCTRRNLPALAELMGLAAKPPAPALRRSHVAAKRPQTAA